MSSIGPSPPAAPFVRDAWRPANPSLALRELGVTVQQHLALLSSRGLGRLTASKEGRTFPSAVTTSVGRSASRIRDCLSDALRGPCATPQEWHTGRRPYHPALAPLQTTSCSVTANDTATGTSRRVLVHAALKTAAPRSARSSPPARPSMRGSEQRELLDPDLHPSKVMARLGVRVRGAAGA